MKIQQNFENIRLELDPNKILFAPNNEGIIAYEEFKDIPNYEGIYQVSSFGRVKSLNYRNSKKVRLLKISKTKKGYLCVGLYKNSISKNWNIHKIVAITFLGHVPNGHVIIVDHKNNIKAHNFKWNLQLISVRENTSKDRKNGKSKYTGVYKERNNWKSAMLINGKNKHLGMFDTEEEASECYQNAVKSIENGLKVKVKKCNFSSNHKGVSWHKHTKKWTASKCLNKNRIHLGYFKNEEEAKIAYDNYCIKNNTQIQTIIK